MRWLMLALFTNMMLVAEFGTSRSANLPPAAPPVIRPSVSAQPTRTPLVNPGARVPVALPPPISLAQAWTKDVCAAHGGSAGSIACYIGLPAGKLALVWTYPYSNPIDGYNVYRADDAAPSAPMTLHMMGAAKPIASQANSAWKFAVLDAQKAGSCFAVTAYHGSDESARSVRFCVGEHGVAKMVSLNPDRVGTMVETDYIAGSESVMGPGCGAPACYSSLSNVNVGYRKDPDASYIPPGGVDVTQQNKISVNVNSYFTGYVHFNTAALNGRLIAQAKLSLLGGTTQGEAGGELCLAHYAGTNRLWNPGDVLRIPTSGMGNGSYQGPDLHLDVTSLAQTWANSPSSNYGIEMDGGKQMLNYQASLPPPHSYIAVLTSTCLTTFPRATLDVTYY
jgi:hypothetical protein